MNATEFPGGMHSLPVEQALTKRQLLAVPDGFAGGLRDSSRNVCSLLPRKLVARPLSRLSRRQEIFKTSLSYSTAIPGNAVGSFVSLVGVRSTSHAGLPTCFQLQAADNSVLPSAELHWNCLSLIVTEEFLYSGRSVRFASAS